MVYSSSTIWAEYKFNDSLYYFKHQGLFFLVGLLAMFIVSKIDYKLYLKYSNKKVRKYDINVRLKGGAYKKVFDYWWTVD